MAKRGIVTIILNPDSGVKLVDIDAPGRDCEDIEKLMNAVQRLLGVEPEGRQDEDDPRPRQAEATRHPDRVKN